MFILCQTADQYHEHPLQVSHTVPVSKFYSPEFFLFLYLVTVPDSLHPFQFWLLKLLGTIVASWDL